MKVSFILLIISTIFLMIYAQNSTNTTCVDTGFDCCSKAGLCTNSGYLTIMRTRCRKTCGFCNTTTTG
ncbi:unnamed protein product, partial [Mesorhabditis belari]|uniref:ShKT domain-containing protein n=1 Tax=Mesorhabditis belari TaxID=2138241 RepID=A0AAF3EC25_9BILA